MLIAQRYALLLRLLQSVDEYTPVRVLDVHMGITVLTRTPSNMRRAFYEGMSFGEFSVFHLISIKAPGQDPGLMIDETHLKRKIKFFYIL